MYRKKLKDMTMRDRVEYLIEEVRKEVDSYANDDYIDVDKANMVANLGLSLAVHTELLLKELKKECDRCGYKVLGG
jgi:hypothetical protein